MRYRLPALALLPVLALTTACSEKASGDAIAITATDSECTIAKDDLPAGESTFKVTNKGSKVTEVYIYDGTRVVTERENIGPGTSAEFSADLAAGAYEIACKPGQTGDGIRADITVTGDGGTTAESEYDREVEFSAVDFSFKGLEGFTAKAGEKIEFKLENDGKADHEFEVFGPDESVLGEIGPTKPGTEGEVILELAVAGTYRYVCDVDDHKTRGMVGTFTVA